MLDSEAGIKFRGTLSEKLAEPEFELKAARKMNTHRG
jgi:hypothetical protein